MSSKKKKGPKGPPPEDAFIVDLNRVFSSHKYKSGVGFEVLGTLTSHSKLFKNESALFQYLVKHPQPITSNGMNTKMGFFTFRSCEESTNRMMRKCQLMMFGSLSILFLARSRKRNFLLS